jgi:hypothetical protein
MVWGWFIIEVWIQGEGGKDVSGPGHINGQAVTFKRVQSHMLSCSTILKMLIKLNQK